MNGQNIFHLLEDLMIHCCTIYQYQPLECTFICE